MRDGKEVVLHIYEPLPSSNTTHTSNPELRPCVINFHGGGFTIGSGTDDSRWAHWVTRTSTSEVGATNETTTSAPSTMTRDKELGLGGIFISVEYRLAPEYPFPIPVNDCIDATKYILAHTEEFGIDRGKVFLSGFSAGGSLAVTTALALSSSSSSTTTSTTMSTTSTTPAQDLTNDTQTNPIAGVIAFYPVLDFSTPRSIKLANSNPQGGVVKPLPGWMTRMFDTSYLPPSPSIDRLDPMISPGLIDEKELEEFPSCHLVLCGADVLAAEGRDFGRKLEQAGETKGTREVVVRTVVGARHGWDKPPLPLQASVGVEYNAAVASMRRWCL